MFAKVLEKFLSYAVDLVEGRPSGKCPASENEVDSAMSAQDTTMIAQLFGFAVAPNDYEESSHDNVIETQKASTGRTSSRTGINGSQFFEESDQDPSNLGYALRPPGSVVIQGIYNPSLDPMAICDNQY